MAASVPALAALTTPRVRYEPRGASRELFGRHEPEVMIDGPAGTGKTLGSCWRMHLAATKYPKMRGLMVRKVQEDLTASAVVTYRERVLGAGHFGVVPYGGSRFEPASFQYPNGSKIFLGGLDKANKVMSREYDIIYANEATELSEEDWENLNARARWGVMPYQILWGDCNPQGPGHWIHRRWQAGKLVMLHSVHKDNPALWDGHKWTPEGQAYLDRLSSLTGFRRDRLLLGKWTAAEGAVYPMFDRQTHVRTVDTEGWATVLGMDVGTRNPTALIVCKYAGERRHYAAEHYERGMSSDSITDLAVRMWEQHRPEFMVIDPSAAGLIASLDARGIRVRKADNDVLVGISKMSSLVAGRTPDETPLLTVDPSCVNLMIEFESYRYPDGRRGNSDSPIKENDHLMDAARYIEMALTASESSLTAVPTQLARVLSEWME